MFYLLVIRFEYHHLYSENSLLENIQGTLLLIGSLTYILLSSHVVSDVRLACVGAGLLCFSFFIREVDLELMPVLEHVGFFFHGPGRTLLLLVIWFLYIKMVIRQRVLKVHIANLRSSKYFHYFSVAFLLLVIGAVFDKGYFVVEHGRLFEELSETNAYLFLIMPALYELYFRYSKRSRQAANLAVSAKETAL